MLIGLETNVSPKYPDKVFQTNSEQCFNDFHTNNMITPKEFLTITKIGGEVKLSKTKKGVKKWKTILKK